MHRKSAEILAITISLAAIGAWQYTKFSNGHGIFYYLSPRLGGWVLLACLVLMYLWGLYYLLAHKSQD